MFGSSFPLQVMGDSTATELVVEEVEEKDKSGDESGKKPDADKKLAKEKTKLTEKKGLKRPGEEPGGGDPKKCKKCIQLQEIVEQLECRLQVEKTKFGVAHEEIVALNRQNIENRKQLDESATRLKEMAEKLKLKSLNH